MRQKGKKDITLQQKNEVAQFLLQHHRNGVLPRGALDEAASIFNLCKRSLATIWQQVHQQIKTGEYVHFGPSKRLGVTHKDKLQLDKEKVLSLSVLERSSIRKMAPKIGVSKTTLGKWIKEKLIRAHTSAIKPTLTPANKLGRLKFSLSNLSSTHLGEAKMKFQKMHNIIHIDEKWFYMTKTCDRYYLLPGEADPYRSTKSKRFITKIMFMCAVGRPEFSNDGACIFDGKIGLFPFTVEEPAKRNNKNRKKGTLETKAINSITKDVIKSCIIDKIIPAIKAKWPPHRTKDIIIQQDNAKPHINTKDPDFISAACSDGFNMTSSNQPANSPDMNVNDLGFFNMISSLQDTKPARNVDDLLKNVINSYEELTAQKLNHVFLTLQCCFAEILKIKGGNEYKIPHMNMNRLEAMGQLLESIEVEESLVKEVIQYLQLPENDCDSSYDIASLVNHYAIE